MEATERDAAPRLAGGTPTRPFWSQRVFRREVLVSYRTDPNALSTMLPPMCSVRDEARITVRVGLNTANEISVATASVVANVECNGTDGKYPLLVASNSGQDAAALQTCWGFPAKFATITLHRNGSAVTGSVMRHGVEILGTRTTLVDDLEPPVDPQTETWYTFNGLRSPEWFGYLDDPLLIATTRTCEVQTVEGGMGYARLGTKDHDPLSDLPQLGDVTVRASERFTTTTSMVAGRVDADGHLGFEHQRHDRP